MTKKKDSAEKAWKKEPVKKTHGICSVCIEEFKTEDLQLVEVKARIFKNSTYYTPLCEKCIPKNDRVVRVLGNYKEIIRADNKKRNIWRMDTDNK